jgi:hypothetical protein
MLKCNQCGKRIIDKEDVKFRVHGLLYPIAYCNYKCAFNKKFGWYSSNWPISIKTEFILDFIGTLFAIAVSIFLLIKFSDILFIILLIMIIMWASVAVGWWMYFLMKKEIAKINN